MNKYLNSSEKKNIKRLIGEIESKSSAEIMVAVTNSLENSKYMIFLYSILFTIISLAILIFFNISSYKMLAEFALIIFPFIYFILLYNPFTYMLIPKSVKRKRCDDFALYQFNKLGVNRKSSHKAILIFICLRERFIRVIADKRIDDIVPNDTWQKIISDFITHAKDDKIAVGILQAVDDCGDILIKNFPKDSESTEELSNDVIEI